MVFKIDLMAVLVLFAFFGITLTMGLGSHTTEIDRVSLEAAPVQNVKPVAQKAVQVEQAQYVQPVQQVSESGLESPSI